MAAQFVRLLEEAVTAPELPLHRLDLLSAEERHSLLKTWNATAHPVPEATIPQLFEGQVARAPEAVALIFGEERLSYGELNTRSNRLAHHLIGLGIGPESLVGVALERSVDRQAIEERAVKDPCALGGVAVALEIEIVDGDVLRFESDVNRGKVVQRANEQDRGRRERQ